MACSPTADSPMNTDCGRGATLISLPSSSRHERICLSASPAELLAAQHRMPPAIAARHSQRVGMLRYFDTMLADPGTKNITGPGVEDAADGLLVYFLGPPEEATQLPCFRTQQAHCDRYHQ